MPVPEATVNKNDRPVFLQYQIGLTGQALIVQPVTVATSEQTLAHHNFRLRVFSADSRHIAAAGSWSMNIWHTGPGF